MVAAFISIMLIVLSRFHPPSWCCHGLVYWESESNTTMLRSSPEVVLTEDTVTQPAPSSSKRPSEIQVSASSSGRLPTRNKNVDSAKNKTIVVYSAPTTLTKQLYNDNFEYFLNNGLPSSRHGCGLNIAVIVVLTKATLEHYTAHISKYNATCGEIRTIVREDRCLDMESARVVLQSRVSFDNFLFLNCGLKGPFQDTHISTYWTHTFIERLNSNVKLTGLTINCGGKLNTYHAHVQSMLWATDRIGLAAIQKAGAIYDCGDQLTDKHGRDQLIVDYELGLSRAVMKAGYAIQDIMTTRTFRWPEAQTSTCTDVWNDAHLIDKYSPKMLHFWKVSRGSQSRALSNWLDKN